MSSPSRSETDRRTFLQVAGASVVSLPLLEDLSTADGAAAAEAKADLTIEPNHHVPADKKLDPRWLHQLFEKGNRDVYRADRLKAIGMPVCGIGTGQLYIRGDGTLAKWEIFNNVRFSGYGATNYSMKTPPSPVDSGFALWIKGADGKGQLRILDGSNYPNVEFVGEYPLAEVRYMDDPSDPIGVDVKLEAFSPFIPLNAKDSALPATVLRYTVTNKTNKPVHAAIGGWLENAVMKDQGGKIRAESINQPFAVRNIRGVVFGSEEIPAPIARPPRRPGEVFEDFEDGDFDGWNAEGKAFEQLPVTGEVDWQQKVGNFQGKRLVNSFVDGAGDKPIGTLTSKAFTIRRPWIKFRMGGGNYQGRTCVNLVIDEKVVRTAEGRNSERLEWRSWDVGQFYGRKARFQIVDNEQGAWGHVLVDDIQFADEPANGTVVSPSQRHDFGTMAIAVLGEETTTLTAFDSHAAFFHELGQEEHRAGESAAVRYPLGLGWPGAAAARFTLEPKQEKTVTFLVTWCFPNIPQGHRYSNWFADAREVAEYLAENLDRLYGDTRLWHDTYYDSTLPHWLLDRLHAPIANLATNTCQWWKNGRFWAYEGVGCCHGTCTHVWNYEHGLARLFPELERSVREMQDLGAAFDEKTGRVGFRGKQAYAADGQAGTILKAYREHLMSPDDGFLKRNWPRIKKALTYSIDQDADADGLIENSQHNTFDINFFGPNTFVGSLYLGALRAGEAMAGRTGDKAFADRCRKIFETGRAKTMARLWNGEYFIHDVDLSKHPKHQYGTGCLSDQLFGQGWAHQVGLGYLYPIEAVVSALRAVFKYNWAPDVGTQNAVHKPQRVFCRPGEAGLFTCTWPKGNRPKTPVLYKNEIWTGIEYQVAGHMIWEGMIEEALTIIRAVHDRYDGARHNPWNEVECGDHYARALASWGCLLAAEGYVCDGPAGRIGFAPRIRAENFRAAFTAAEGWGTIEQKREDDRQIQKIRTVWGKLAVKELVFQLPENKTIHAAQVKLGNHSVRATTTPDGKQITLRLTEPLTVPTGEELAVTMQLS